MTQSKVTPATEHSPSPATEMPFKLKKNPRDQSILHALLPGSRVDKNTNKIVVRTATSNETIRFNVGGHYFETFVSTLRALPHCLLANDAFLKNHHRTEHSDYFFDRDPAIFHCILNYLRSGELHLPSSVCGPVVKSELEYWGIEEIEIEECCWNRYSTWATTLQSLRKLEADRTGNVLQWHTAEAGRTSSRLSHQNVWNFFVDPTSSFAASIYSYASLTVIFISIFCFCAQTHRDFQVTHTVLTLNDSISTSSVTPLQLQVSLATTDNHTLTRTLPSSHLDLDAYYKVDVKRPHPVLHYVDVSCFLFILLELVFRFVVCPRKMRFLVQVMTAIELLALLPDVCLLVLQLTGLDYHSAILNFMRIFRIFRIFRLMKQIPGLWILIYTLKASVKDLILLLLFLCLGMLIFSSLVYFAEREEEGTAFTSIPMCFWWAVITMTTVGYGDMSPATTLGFLVGTLTAVSGLLMIGFTVPVLVNNFVLYYNHTQAAIGREKQRAKLAKHAHAKRVSTDNGKGQQDGQKKAVNGPGGMFFGSFDHFKHSANGSDTKNKSITTDESNTDDNGNISLSQRTDRDRNLENKDLKIVTDNAQWDAVEPSEKDITAM